MPPPTVYCIDTCALIDGWVRRYPPDTFAALWEHRIEGLIEEGRLIAPEEVLHELERGGDELHEWAKAHDRMFLPLDDGVVAFAAEVVNDHLAFVPDDSKDGIWADPYVVGLAVMRGATVVTAEKLKPPGSKRPKIPNVCQTYSIPYVELLALIRAEGWRF